MPDYVPLIIGFATMALIIFAFVTRRLDPAPPKPRPHPEPPGYCAPCIHRAGDKCTNPKSPVYPGACDPVSVGKVKCSVRTEGER
jgi:hypothetical protein